MGTAWAHLGSYLLSRNVEQFRKGLVFKAHRLLHHSTLGSRVVKKKKTSASMRAASTATRSVRVERGEARVENSVFCVCVRVCVSV